MSFAMQEQRLPRNVQRLRLRYGLVQKFGGTFLFLTLQKQAPIEVIPMRTHWFDDRTQYEARAFDLREVAGES